MNSEEIRVEGKIGEENGVCYTAIPAGSLKRGINEILLETDADKTESYLLVETVMLEKYEK